MTTGTPVNIEFSLAPVLRKLEKRMDKSAHDISKKYIRSILDYANDYPELKSGISEMDSVAKYREQIDVILENLFPSVLTKNEIKAASMPFKNTIFHPTARFKNIFAEAGEDYSLEIRNLDLESKYVLICTVILSEYYNYDVNLSKPLFVDIPDKNGTQKHYRMSINADFVDILPNDNAVEITDDIAEKLINNVDDIDLWKKYFPENSWTLSGIVIMNLTDVTVEDAISDLKTTLLLSKKLDSNKAYFEFEKIFKSLFNNSGIRLGFTELDDSNTSFMQMEQSFSQSFVLNEEYMEDCHRLLCDRAYDQLIQKHDYFVITDVEAYAKETKHNELSKALLKHNVQSCILAPIARENKILAILEIVAPRKYDLNSINAKKLDDILPYIVSTMERRRFDRENRIKAVIQSECTSIHPSVLWVFEEEARRYILNQEAGKFNTFRDITFEDVYPLYGQIDIVGSSEARNTAIQKDIRIQLKMVHNILENALEQKAMPIYEQMRFRVDEFSEKIETNLDAGSENEVLDLLQNEINPLLDHLTETIPSLENAVANYKSAINLDNGIIYDNRKNYDDTVRLLNQKLASYLDRKQKDAQEIYPHYFERYKTDGVDHNIYIGGSMNKNKAFNPVYLYNLRLWQLRTMCEMENQFYHEQENAHLQLNAASMILVFSTTLSIKYRMDEKKFDVDGTYNARYEVIKKRIDKALIKNNTERVTQKGKIAIIYSQDRDAVEYIRYIKYLQSKNYLGDKIEYLELEDVQGVVGLKALRVEVLYSEKLPRKKDDTITYADLMEVLD